MGDSGFRQWCVEGGKEEWLRLIDFIEPGNPPEDPINPVLRPILGKAREILAKLTLQEVGEAFDELSAYEPPPRWPKGREEEYVRYQVRAIYEALREQGIGYAVERWDSQCPAQVIRSHKEILDSEGIGGPCIDLVLLMAACLEAIGIQPLVIVVSDGGKQERRHAILAYRLKELIYGPQTSASEIPHLFLPVEEPRDRGKGERVFGLLSAQNLSMMKDAGAVEFINCTGFTRGENIPFEQARSQGVGYVEQWNLVFALDVRVARHTLLTREIRDYLERLRDDILTLPSALGFPSDQNFSTIRMHVKVRKGARRFSEAEARFWEIARRQGYTEKETSKAYQYPWFSPEEEMKHEAERPLDWDREVRGRIKRAIILGDPGFGKTWLLKHEALKLAKAALEKLNCFPLATNEIQLPIFLPLVQLAEHMDPQGKSLPLEQAVIQVLEEDNRYPLGKKLREWIKQSLESERLVLLLDALDEVPEQHRESLFEGLDKFARRYTGPHILLTSRLVGYPGAPFPLSKEGEFELLPFDRRQQREFVQAWFSGRPERGEAFFRKLQESPQVQALAGIPLLLALMCRLFDESDEFPKSRAELYEACIWGILTREWKASSPADDPYLHAKRKLVEEIAYRLFLAEKELFRLDELMDTVEGIFREQPRLEQNLQNKSPANLIRELQRDGLLIKAGAGIHPPFLFLHLTLQEYLTACALARRTKMVQLDGQEVPEWLKLVRPYLFQPKWREIITMLPSRLDDASLLLKAIWDQQEDFLLNRLFIACECLGEARFVENPIVREIRRTVMSILEKALAEVQLKAVYEVYEVRALLKVRNGFFDRRFAWAIGRLAEKGIVTLDELFHLATAVFEHLRQKNFACTYETRTFLSVLLNAIASVSPDTAQKILWPVIKQRPVSPFAETLLTSVADHLPDAFLREALYHGCVYAAKALQSRGEDLGDYLLAEMTQRFQHLLSDWYELEAYIRTLGRIREQKALPLLVEFLRGSLPFDVDRTTGIRVSAALALAEIADAQAIPYLLETVKDFQHRFELETALYALRMIGLPSLEPIVGLLLSKQSHIAAYDDVLRCALAIVRECGCPDPLATELTSFLDAPQWQLRLLAATALAIRGDEVGRSKLIALLNCPEAARDAALALARIKARDAVPPLCKLLDAFLAQCERERNPDLMTAIIRALDKISACLRGEEDETELGRVIIWALGEIGGQEAVDQLKRVLHCDDIDGLLRLEAAIGLTKNAEVDLPIASTIASIGVKFFNRRVFPDSLLWIARRVRFRMLLSGEVEPY
jgi:HEAT repeat protein